MAGENSIQVLRATSTGIAHHATDVLLDGQPLYDKTNNWLIMGRNSKIGSSYSISVDYSKDCLSTEEIEDMWIEASQLLPANLTWKNTANNNLLIAGVYAGEGFNYVALGNPEAGRNYQDTSTEYTILLKLDLLTLLVSEEAKGNTVSNISITLSARDRMTHGQLDLYYLPNGYGRSETLIQTTSFPGSYTFTITSDQLSRLPRSEVLFEIKASTSWLTNYAEVQVFYPELTALTIN